MNTGDHILKQMEANLKQLNDTHPSAIGVIASIKRNLSRGNDALVGYLYEETNPIPHWDDYPLARDYFTQN